MMARVLYQALLWLALPLVPLRLAWRARREPGYGERWRERFGRAPAHLAKGCIWFHAVSAGETIAVAPLINALAAEFPAASCLVTTMTPAGDRQAQQRLGAKVAHCYAPYDFPFAVRAFFRAAQPKLLVLVETELWPNLISEAWRRDVPVLVINARLSERSARAYARAPKLTRAMLGQLDLIACQYADQARRFVALGAAPSKVQVLGSVKFDAVLPPGHGREVAAMRGKLGLAGRPVWIAASTHEGEERAALRAHQIVRRRFPSACLLLAPRHPARSAAVVELAQRLELSAGLLSSSLPHAVAVVVCDGFGLLQTLYGLSQVAFVGGSLAPVGGHNPIEAALCGASLVMGPHTFNFTEVVAAFVAAGCLTTVRDASDLAAAVLAGFADAAAREAAGLRAGEVVRDNRGAAERLLALLRPRIQALTGQETGTC